MLANIRQELLHDRGGLFLGKADAVLRTVPFDVLQQRRAGRVKAFDLIQIEHEMRDCLLLQDIHDVSPDIAHLRINECTMEMENKLFLIYSFELHVSLVHRPSGHRSYAHSNT